MDSHDRLVRFNGGNGVSSILSTLSKPFISAYANDFALYIFCDMTIVKENARRMLKL